MVPAAAMPSALIPQEASFAFVTLATWETGLHAQVNFQLKPRLGNYLSVLEKQTTVIHINTHVSFHAMCLNEGKS